MSLLLLSLLLGGGKCAHWSNTGPVTTGYWEEGLADSQETLSAQQCPCPQTPGRVGVGNAMGHWILGGWELHTVPVPPAGSDADGAAVMLCRLRKRDPEGVP